jgi:Protein of unknown function (DUF3277)
MAGQVFTTYSFLDVQATLVAPSVTFDIASAGVSAEGIRLSMVGEKDVMTVGADGDVMHTLIASDASNCEISLLKDAAGNKLLNDLYNFQKASSANWGGIQITIANNVTGDTITLVGGAFAKQADISYAQEGTMNVWPFKFGFRVDTLGNGLNGTAAIFTTF